MVLVCDASSQLAFLEGVTHLPNQSAIVSFTHIASYACEWRLVSGRKGPFGTDWLPHHHQSAPYRAVVNTHVADHHQCVTEY